MTGSDRALAESTADPALGDVEAEFPRWHCWQGISGLYYASLRRSSPPVVVRGEHPADLRDSILRALGDL